MRTRLVVETCGQRRWLRLAAVVGLLLVPGALAAQVRASATYAVTAETVDGGGGPGSAGSYANAGSVVPVVAGESAVEDTTILHGFVAAFTVATLTEYDTWALARGLTPGVDAGFFDDPNQDGRPNLNHFAFDTDPLGSGSTEGKRTEGTVNLGGLDYLTLTLPIRTGAIFSGNPLVSNNLDGVSYEILGDTDLDAPWELPVVEVIPALEAGLPALGDYDAAGGADWQYRTFRLTSPLSASTRYFMKAGATAGE